MWKQKEKRPAHDSGPEEPAPATTRCARAGRMSAQPQLQPKHSKVFGNTLREGSHGGLNAEKREQAKAGKDRWGHSGVATVTTRGSSLRGMHLSLGGITAGEREHGTFRPDGVHVNGHRGGPPICWGPGGRRSCPCGLTCPHHRRIKPQTCAHSEESHHPNPGLGTPRRALESLALMGRH